MMNQLIIFTTYSALLIAVMLIAESSYKFLKLNTEWTRKIAHIGSGIIALSYPVYQNTHWGVFALTISFTIILYTSKKMGLFQSIFSVERKSYGELFFVWSTWLLFILYQYSGNVSYFYLAFSSVVFADPVAALVGKPFPLKKYTIFGNTKSIGGSFSFFVVSFALSYYYLLQTGSVMNILLISLTHALVLTIIEAVSSKGLDNLTIPIASVLFIYVTSII